MEEDDEKQPGIADRTVQDLKDYASLRADSVRLSLIDNLSTLFNTLFGVAVILALAGIATVFFAVALTWVLGLLVGSVLYAVLIMGALFVVLAAVVYAFRKRLVVNQSVRLLSRMVYDMSKKYADDGKS